MGYLGKDECDKRIEKVRGLLRAKDLDLVLVYYDEFNIGNGWYLTGWCPQFESGAVLVPREGKIGREIDAPARAYFEREGFSKYLVCPFAHTIGLHEAESPFFGPNSTDELKAGMAVCIDISFFGHPEFNGVRIETGYEITNKRAVPFSKKMDKICRKNV